MPKDYYTLAVNKLATVCDLNGKRVLEIGGDQGLEVANLLLAKGARHVTTINVAYDFTNREVNERLATRNLDATKLCSEFSEESFDVAFGVALLEHVQNLPLMLDQLYAVLSASATVLLKGSPIWTSAAGHHLWVTGTERIYRFNEPINNPIPAWHHLLFTEDEMIQYLKGKKQIGANDAAAIAQYVYRSKSLSRVSYSEMTDILKQSKFQKFRIEEIVGAMPSPRLGDKLRKSRWGLKNKFNVVGLEFLAQKDEVSPT